MKPCSLFSLAIVFGLSQMLSGCLTAKDQRNHGTGGDHLSASPPTLQRNATEIIASHPEMVFVPAGEFVMGSADADIGAEPNEKPVRRVFLDAFLIDRTEVTNEQYEKFLAWMKMSKDHSKCFKGEPAHKDHTPRGFGNTVWNGPEQPVVGVDWYDAYAFAAWSGKRLPTEAEWEKAARGTDGRTFPWGNDWDGAKANGVESRLRVTAAVGSFGADLSPYGCYDMAGNARDWCSDWYSDDYYHRAPSRNPQGPYSPVETLFGRATRVLKGGTWLESGIRGKNARCASRSGMSPAYWSGGIGFRCARSLP